NHNETGVTRATQQPIELSQFAALSFPANPFRLRFAPLTPTVKQMKANCFATAVTPIKFINAVSRSVHGAFVVRHSLAGRVSKISEQCEVQMLVLICQISDLELVN